jgi:hypothetical protein
MKKGFLAGLVMVLAMAFAGPAMAANGTGGWLELCKASGTPAVSGPFAFTVTDGTGSASYSVLTGTCTAPFPVAPGAVTVTETAVPYALVSNIAAIPSTNLVSSSTATGVSHVTVAAGDISTATTLQYTNVEDPGYIEVCKQAAVGTGLTGSFQFTVTGAMGFTTSVTVPVGSCSDPIEVPAGSVNIAENAAATYVTGITAVNEGGNALLASSLSAATSTVAVVGVAPNDADTSQQTLVTYTDSPSILKICKVAGSADLLGDLFQFTAATSSTSQSLSIPAGSASNGGYCQIVPGIYTAGTTVNISEANTPGTDASNIVVAPASREVPGSASFGTADGVTRSVSVVLGSGETDVTYTNSDVDPQLLKICKAATGVPAGSSWTYTIAGDPTPVVVPAGSCTEAGLFPFNSTQVITEKATSGYAVAAISASPADRLAASSLTAGTASAIIGTGVTDVSYTNAASAAVPPAIPVTPGTGSTPGSTSTAGGSTSTATPAGTTGTGSTSGSGSSGSAGKVLTTLSFAKLGGSANKHYVLVKVTSASKTVRVRVTWLGKDGKTHTKTFTIKANKSVKISIKGLKKLKSAHIV